MTPENDESFQPGGLIRVGKLWTMDDPGVQWGVWLNLETGGGVARRETLNSELRARHVPYRSTATTPR